MKGRLLIGVLLGVVLTVVGYKAAVSVCIISNPHRHRIPVDDNSQIPADENEAYISLEKGHSVLWTANASKTLEIKFDKKNFPTGKQPFKTMKSSGDTYLVICTPQNQCDSGEINPDLQGDFSGIFGRLKCLKFPYDQSVDGQKKDGWIIIKP